MNTHDEYEEIEIVDIDAADEVAPVQKKERKHTATSPRLPFYRRRRVQLAATSGIVVLVVLLLVGTYMPTRQVILHAVLPHATATLAPGVDHFYVEGVPPWGRLFIDDKQVRYLPDPMSGDPPVQLTQGKHRFIWVAPPFFLDSCVASVPPDYGTDTCNNTGSIGHDGNSGWLLTFGASLRDLLPSDQNALVHTVETALNANNPPVRMQPGEVYATNDPQHPLGVADEPLLATLRFSVEKIGIVPCGDVQGLESNTCSFRGQDCSLFCTAYPLFSPHDYSVHSQKWDVFGVVSYRWDYTTLDGRVVAASEPDQPLGVAEENHFVPLQITQDKGQWHVVSNTNILNPAIFSAHGTWSLQPACASAVSHVVGDSSLAKASWSYDVVPGPLLACLGTANVPGSQTPAYCLHRFGVFVALNDVAHKTWPTMPVASAYERQAFMPA
jgi:hypothetical protein